jgi:hypothetical protein
MKMTLIVRDRSVMKEIKRAASCTWEMMAHWTGSQPEGVDCASILRVKVSPVPFFFQN